MRVERAVLRELAMELREPFVTSHGTTRGRRVLLLSLLGDGVEGWGECVALPDPSYTYETTDTAWRVLAELLLPRVVGSSLASGDDALAAGRWIRGHPMAKAALEMTAWDLLAKTAGVPLATALGGTRPSVSVGVSVGLDRDVEALAETVGRHLADGYRRVKVKIEPGWDVEPLRVLRARYPEAPIMADANCSYRVEDTPALEALDELDLMMLEQPLGPDDLLDHARLQATLRTPICLDESIGSEGDARLALQLGSCRIVNLKPGRVGGHRAALRIHDLLRASGVPMWMGGMLESGVGRAHNLALASMEGFSLPGDISASRRYWARDIVVPEFEVVDGQMRVPEGPGIGVEVDVELVESLTVRRAEFG